VLEACEAAGVDPEKGEPKFVSGEAVANWPEGKHLDPSTRESIRRAIRTLHEQGRIEAWIIKGSINYERMVGPRPKIDTRVLVARARKP
jgi:hypothetical protein